MPKSIRENSMAHGPSRASTRGTVNSSLQGTFMDKKLPVKLLPKGFLPKFRQCESKKCKTCPSACAEQLDKGNSKLEVFCKNKNLIYMIECKECNLKYIGQTCTELNLRINNHRSTIKNFMKNESKEFELVHFQCHSFENIDICILENNILDLNKRLDRENIYMCSLKTLFPYGLNSKLNGEGYIDAESICVYNKFSIFRGCLNGVEEGRRFKRGRGKGRNSEISFDDFQEICVLDHHWESTVKIRKFIFSLKNNRLKWFLANKFVELKFKNSNIKILILDLIKAKLKIAKSKDLFQSKKMLGKDFCVINFLDISYEKLKIPQIVHENKENFPLKDRTEISIAFKYSKDLKKQICNYNYFSKNLQLICESQCYCNQVPFNKFIDPDKGHIVTGNLEIIESTLLRDLMGKGAKFRLRQVINFNKFFVSLNRDLDMFIAKMARKYHWPVEGFGEWRNKIIEMIKLKFSEDDRTFGIRGIFGKKAILKDIKKLKDKFIITLVDKASNNFCIMCKVYFKELLIQEFNSNSTYSLVKSGKKELDKRLLAFSKKTKIKLGPLNFPYLFPNVKFHKNPSKFRFVTCSTNCYNSNIGKFFFKILRIIQLKIAKEENFIINNNQEVLNFLNNNAIFNIYTFDFENLYTNLPHFKLIEVCNHMYEQYLNDSIIGRYEWMQLCIFNIEENYLFNGINFYKQTTGIPMGSKFSSALANIFLHFYEGKIIRENLIYGFRYIDDLLLLNIENVDLVVNCYPKELKLNRTNVSPLAGNYLDIKIVISNSNVFLGVFDKKEDFHFKVMTLSNFDSNLDSRVMKNILYSQYSRIKKICNNKKEYAKATNCFLNCLYDNNFPANFCNIENIIQEGFTLLKY